MSNISIEGISEPLQPEQMGWKRYFSFNTDHKVIGVQYLVTAFLFFLIGGLLAMIVRAELLTPQLDVVDRSLYNGLFTMHGTIMIFLWIFPANVGLANYLVPLMIGARETAFPVLNAIAFWLIPAVGILLLSSFFLPSGAAQAGWWSYPPVSIQNPSGHLMNGEFIWLLAVAISGLSSIMGGVNLVTTIFQMRAPGMTFFRMPVYVWTTLSAQLLQLFCLPALTGAVIMLLFDLSLGTNFFSPFKQGDPVIYQHLFGFTLILLYTLWHCPPLESSQRFSLSLPVNLCLAIKPSPFPLCSLVQSVRWFGYITCLLVPPQTGCESYS
jgi:cytochrome c oxidase subunit 1